MPAEAADPLKPDAYCGALGATVADDDLSPDGTRRCIQRLNREAESRAELAVTASEELAPRLGITAISARLGLEREGLERYRLGGQLGKGATGVVFSAYDADCHRDIAMKFLRSHLGGDSQAIGRFLHEARVTARLEHPGILPVYEVGVAASGQCYIATRRIDGVSLGDALRGIERGEPAPPVLAGINDRVGVMIRVCEAMAYAHHRGVIHRDIKPDNIMVGAFGEVVLVDWGTAVPSDFRNNVGRVGTPAYMAPEQAAGAAADKRSDVYCLGATMFHLLLGRYPTWSDDLDHFWERKRLGEIDPPTAEERQRVPRALLEITLKALASDPAQRYDDATSLTRDLVRYQQGLAVSAHRDRALVRLARWHRRHARWFWPTTAACGLLIALGVMLWIDQREQATDWHLAFSEDFDGPDAAHRLETQWLPTRLTYYKPSGRPPAGSSAWTVRDGKLRGANGVSENLAYGGRIPGDLRVEWELTPIDRVTNLNCFLAAENRTTGYTFHIGGWHMPLYRVLSSGPQVDILASRMDSEELLPGVTYRMRMEKEGARIRLWINERIVLEADDDDPLSGPDHQSFGFEVIESTVAIDKVRVYSRPLPLRISPLSVADAFAEEGMHQQAAERYQEFMSLHPDDSATTLAHYRMARCLTRLGRHAEARAVFAALAMAQPSSRLGAMARLQQAHLLLLDGKSAEAEPLLEQLADAPESVRRAAMTRISGWIAEQQRLTRLSKAPQQEILERVDATRRQIERWAACWDLSVSHNATMFLCADILSEHGRPDLVLEWTPQCRYQVARALLRMGRPDEVVDNYPDMTALACMALDMAGRHEELVRRYPKDHATLDWLVGQGRQEEAWAAARGNRAQEAQVLTRSGRFEEVISQYPDQTSWMVSSLLSLGRYDEARERFGESDDYRRQVKDLTSDEDRQVSKTEITAANLRQLFLHAFDAAIAGDAKLRDELLDQARAYHFSSEDEWYPCFMGRYVLAPLAAYLDNHDANALDAAWQFAAGPSQGLLYQQKGWYRGRYLLGQCSDEEFLAQPDRRYADRYPGELFLLRGMRAERAGDVAAARAAYAQYPAKESGYIRAFVRWRLQTLQP
ncbi:MAG: protein kinase [Planctomycetes bacterium]|nr:protein kinase [Planctomycetota bacterium]